MRRDISNTEIMFLISIVILVLVFMPFGIIWSLDTLFHLGIPYTWKTWGAAGFLWSLFGNVSKKGEK